jgi:hypothetical protein
MDPTQAEATLMQHAGIVDGPRMADGLVGMLRPYRGLDERNLHEVVGCIHALKGILRGDLLPRDLPRALLTIATRVRTMAIMPAGMLRRNSLITEADCQRLTFWLDVIEGAAIRYMGGLADAVALSGYMDYLIAAGGGPVSEAAAAAAITSSFDLDDDYQIKAVQVCLGYGPLGDRFADLVSSLDTTGKDPELARLVAQFRDQRSGPERAGQ